MQDATPARFPDGILIWLGHRFGIGCPCKPAGTVAMGKSTMSKKSEFVVGWTILHAVGVLLAAWMMVMVVPALVAIFGIPDGRGDRLHVWIIQNAVLVRVAVVMPLLFAVCYGLLSGLFFYRAGGLGLPGKPGSRTWFAASCAAAALVGMLMLYYHVDHFLSHALIFYSIGPFGFTDFLRNNYLALLLLAAVLLLALAVPFGLQRRALAPVFAFGASLLSLLYLAGTIHAVAMYASGFSVPSAGGYTVVAVIFGLLLPPILLGAYQRWKLVIAPPELTA